MTGAQLIVGGKMLELHMKWAEVLAHAHYVLRLAKASARPHPDGSDVIALVRAEMEESAIRLFFQRRIKIPNRPESIAEYALAILYSSVEYATAPVVWQASILDAVQRLRAEVPALGFVRYEEGDGPFGKEPKL